ncbi:MAG TPA: ferrous iron transporter B [Tepidisphaeraceae bacterium]|nr:ferrous iron transporter B [Tepidisphaeraceae bacterium]
MASCCDTLDPASPAPPGTLTIALAGNPNSGKTTLFNALTGLRQKVANYPGVTVEKKTGRCKLPDGRWADIIDLPGTYSLISRSPDERVAMEVLRGLRKDCKTPDAVVVVVDASNLQRNLYLVSQLIELGRPLVIALNMMDIAQRRGLNVSPANLQAALGVPVIPVVGYKRRGIDDLKAAILKATVAPLPDWMLPDAMKEELMVVGGGLAILDAQEPVGLMKMPPPSEYRERENRLAGTNEIGRPPDGISISPAAAPESLDTLGPVPPRAWICRGDTDRRIDRYTALAERLLIGDRAPDVQPIAEREPVASLLAASVGRLHALGIDPMQADVEAHYHWIEQVAHNAIGDGALVASPGTSPIGSESSAVLPANKTISYATPRRILTLTDRVDAILVHKFWGLLIFAGIMGLLFLSLFWLAQPIMDAIQAGIKGLAGLTTGRMTAGPLKDLLVDGIFNGVGVVVVFVPQIALLFMFLAILEDSGYLARAAFLMDRLLSKVGLHGKSFIPLLSSFACAIPGIMATRTIENRRERLATILVAPFMSCSARLPVYTLLIAAFFSAETLGISTAKAAFLKAGIMLGCYALGIIAAAGTAWVFKRTLTKGPATSFILELPTYKIPQVSQVARQIFTNTKAFLVKAGTTIFCLSIILWAMAYYPRLPAQRAAEISKPYDEQMAILMGSNSDATVPVAVPPSASAPGRSVVVCTITMSDVTKKVTNKKEQAIAAAQSEYSISGRFGHFIEPAIRPLGFDWKMGVGLVSAFAAREVFISSMGIVYSVGKVEDDQTADLAGAMRHDTYAAGPKAGTRVWTPLVAISLLVWFVLAMQCMSTFAIVRRETGGWRWPIFMLLYMNALAYIVSLLVFQVGSKLFA